MLQQLLDQVVQNRASDLFLSVGAPPSLKAEGHTRHLGEVALNSAQMQAMVASILSEEQRKDFAANQDLSLALPYNEQGRFRISLYRQRGEIAIAVRFIPARIPSLEELNLPAKLKDLRCCRAAWCWW
jgi:twitching motility protein PilU